MKNKMILIVYGTRPEYLKIKPLIKEFKLNNIKYKVLFTGQQKDIAVDDADFSIKMEDSIENRLNIIVKSCLSIPQYVFKNIKTILVQGDTSTALGLALNAFHRKIKIIHLEAGLRTNDLENPYPEETNRQIISRISDINFCPTTENLNNLKKENIKGKCYVVGNTVLDNLVDYKNQCEYQNKILITLHRRENHSIIKEWFLEINKLAKTNRHLEFILPIHPNPNVQKYKNLLKNVNVIDPLPHEDLIKILIKTKLVITDSGGLQEECSFFNKKTLICRKITERSECLGHSGFLIKNANSLQKSFDKHIIDYSINFKSPYGDGKSAKKIVNIIKKNYL